MPLDTPLVLTHDHDPNVIFRGQFLPHLGQSLDSPRSPVSYEDLWTNFQHLSRAYHDLLSRHRDLSDVHQALQGEHSVLRDSYASLVSKHQEHVDDAINTRIQSWRYVVRVEELEKELRLLRQGDIHSILSKRKYADLEDADNDAAESEWSASSCSYSQSLTNDTFNTPASSKIAHAPGIRRGASDDIISSGAQLVTSLAEPTRNSSADIRTPKRRKECGSLFDLERASADVDIQRRGPIVTPIGRPIRQEDMTLETHSRPIPLTRRSPPQTRSKTRSFRRKRPAAIEQNATAAAVAAALSGTAVSQPDRSSSPSPAMRGTL